MIQRGHKYEIIGWDNQYGNEFPETMPQVLKVDDKMKLMKRTLVENNRTVATILGGAILGGTLTSGNPIGMAIVGVIGAIVSESRNAEIRKNKI